MYITIDFLNEHGDIYLVRLPISLELMRIENKVIPNFNEKIIIIIADKTSGYIAMTSKNKVNIQMVYIFKKSQEK